MNLFQLDCFLHVAESGSFSEAARKLFVSQSSVSQNVKSLERELGFALFDRGGGKVTITRAGAHLERSMRKIRHMFDAAIEEARSMANEMSSKLIIGYEAPLSHAWLGESIQALKRHCPNLNVELRKRSMAALAEMLLEDKIDVAITLEHMVEGVPDVTFKPLRRACGCVYISAHHRLSEKKDVSLRDLEGETLIAVCHPGKTQTLTRSAVLLEELGFDFSKALHVTDEETAFSMVDAGLGLFVAGHFCDDYARQFSIVGKDLSGGMPEVSMGLAYIKASSNVNDFAHCARSVIRRK